MLKRLLKICSFNLKGLLRFISLFFIAPLSLSTSFTSFSKETKVSRFNQNKKTKIKDGLEVNDAYYKKLLGTGEELSKNLSLPSNQTEKLATKIYNFFNKKTDSTKDLKNFFEVALRDAKYLFLVAKLAYFSDSKDKGDRYLSYTSSLLNILTLVREKFSDKLRALIVKNTFDVKHLLKFSPLIEAGINILKHTYSITELTFSFGEVELSQKRKRLDKLFETLEILERDSNLYRNKKKEHLENIKATLSPTQRAFLWVNRFEWEMALTNLREKAVELEFQIPNQMS